jgi:hypothetical protein
MEQGHAGTGTEMLLLFKLKWCCYLSKNAAEICVQIISNVAEILVHNLLEFLFKIY